MAASARCRSVGVGLVGDAEDTDAVLGDALGGGPRTAGSVEDGGGCAHGEVTRPTRWSNVGSGVECISQTPGNVNASMLPTQRLAVPA